MPIILGKRFYFDVEVREYDGSKCIDKVIVYAQSFTEALEIIQKACITDSDCLVKFTGEGK